MGKKSKGSKYDHLKIESKWQREWSRSKTYQTTETTGSTSSRQESKPKAYVLDMFPYPSGEGLHVGHPKGYIATDVYSRFKRMSGFNVLHPMGWDAFGLPAENYAIKNKINPAVAVKKNIKHFKSQMEKIGLDYDWSREINTTDPKYYKWTQWIFLQLFKRGLAYQSNEPINWCPSCQTGLANEDLETRSTSSGQAAVCERCGSLVIKKPIRQWVLKITNYAERLLTDLDGLNWPESIKESQRNWIGRSEGAEIDFPLQTGPLKFVILHGWKSNSRRCFIPWLKRELEERGHEVVALDLPHPVVPNIAEQVDYVLSKVTFDANTIIIAHSLGSIAAYRILEKLKTPIKKLVIVAGLIEPKFRDKARPEAKYLLSWKFNLAKIKKNAGQIVILEDQNDNIIPKGESRVIQQALGGEVYQLEAQTAHFCGSVEPLVLGHSLDRVKIFTTRADTLFGATYLVLAPEHKLISQLKKEISNWVEVTKYIKQAEKRTEIERSTEGREKTGVKLEGVRAINPINNEEIPIFIADYVLPGYGTGAIMAVPAHDERDHQFAKKFDLPIVPVIIKDLPTTLDHVAEAYTGSGKMVNSGRWNGLDNEQVVDPMIKFVRGKKVIRYKLRDWVFSRQRYWGEPIPIVHCAKCGPMPVPEKDLPVKLPAVKSYAPTGTGESPLANIKSWVNTKCPACGGPAQRETNTMPQWAGSSWYYLRYIDPKNDKALADPKKLNYWSPVDMYVGGTEHATRHLIYARFWHKFLQDIGIVKNSEPFAQLKNQGLISGSDGRKMSKRWGNVINPDDIIKSHGADTLRVYEMFMGPFEQGVSWSTDNLMGARRFVEKIWRLNGKVVPEAKVVRSTTSGSLEVGLLTTESASEVSPQVSPRSLLGNNDFLLHKTIKQVTDDINRFNFNTAISALMILANDWDKLKQISITDFKILLKLLAPLAPHLSEELWHNLGEKKSIHLSTWPVADPQKLITKEVKIVVQINGKVRATLDLPVGQIEEEVINLALANPMVQKWLPAGQYKKTIFIKDKLLNFVL